MRAQDRDTVELRMQNTTTNECTASLIWQGSKVRLGSLAPAEIGTWLLARARNGWRALRAPATSR
jgi:hypothetical protein